MATAKKAAKKAARKTSVKKAAVKTSAPKPEAPKSTATKQAPRASMSKDEALAAKQAGIANASDTKKTTNPKGSWPFPTGERP